MAAPAKPERLQPAVRVAPAALRVNEDDGSRARSEHAMPAVG